MNILELAYMRVVDVEDLILNTFGGILAWYIFKFIYKDKVKNIIDSIYQDDEV
ncbi:MAG: hypothetical protein R3Y64_00550 [Peptostreptococcaceae bacterium]